MTTTSQYISVASLVLSILDDQPTQQSMRYQRLEVPKRIVMAMRYPLSSPLKAINCFAATLLPQLNRRSLLTNPNPSKSTPSFNRVRSDSSNQFQVRGQVNRQTIPKSHCPRG
jgi:hypothetical protein